MKKAFINFFALAALSFTLVACGSDKKESEHDSDDYSYSSNSKKSGYGSDASGADSGFDIYSEQVAEYPVSETEQSTATSDGSTQITLVPMPNQPVAGADAKYFAFKGENGSKDIVLQCTPREDGRGGTIRASVQIKVSAFKKKNEGFASSPTLPLYIYNADKEGPGGYCRMEMSLPDARALEDLVKQRKSGTLTVIYKTDFTSSQYKEILASAKYFQIQSADISTGSDSSSSSSSSYSSNDDGDDDDSDDSSSGSSTKEKAKKMYYKAKEKSKEVYGKAKEKASDWYNKAKEKWDEW